MLATQGANGTFGTAERDALIAEMTQLIAGIDSIAGRTHFSDNNLLDGTAYTIQVSSTADDSIELDAEAFADISFPKS